MRPAQAIKWYHQPYVCSNIQSFSQHFLWDALGGPEKDRVLCVWWSVSGSFSTDSPGQLDVLGHDGDPPGMDGTEVNILKQSHEVRFSSLLEC